VTTVAPPEPPSPSSLLVDLADDNRRRFWYRHWLLAWTVLTILAMAWLITLGPVPGVLGLAVGKHVLVALLLMALGMDQRHPREN
jgi:hypothetical protein